MAQRSPTARKLVDTELELIREQAEVSFHGSSGGCTPRRYCVPYMRELKLSQTNCGSHCKPLDRAPREEDRSS